MAVGSLDRSWSLHNYIEGKVLLKQSEATQISSVEFHPDGLILAVGLVNGKILIYDIREMTVAQELEGPVAQAVTQMVFSNKGIFLAASWEGHDTTRVYSLHKAFSFAEIRP